MRFDRSRLAAAALFGMASAALIGVSGGARAESRWPAKARVYFIAPANGEKVTGKVTVKFGLSGMGVAPAGVEKPNTGHHHLLVDTDAPTGEQLNQPLPVDAHVRHFGGGQTETVLEFPPGRHTLQLIVGDANHIPHDPPLESDKIVIDVK
jgi:hypothetical protein